MRHIVLLHVHFVFTSHIPQFTAVEMNHWFEIARLSIARQHFMNMLFSMGDATMHHEQLGPTPHLLCASQSQEPSPSLPMVNRWKYFNMIVDQDIQYGLGACAGSNPGVVHAPKYGMICVYSIPCATSQLNIILQRIC